MKDDDNSDNSDNSGKFQVQLTKRYDLNLIHYVEDDCFQNTQMGLHGHSFKVQLVMKSAPDNRTGFTVDLRQLDQVFHEEIFTPYNGQNVNKHMRHGTGEALAQTFYSRLKKTSIGPQLLAVQLIETRKNRFQTTQ